MVKDQKVDALLSQYEPVSKDSAAYTKLLVTIWEKFGKPTDCDGPIGWKMLDNILEVWKRAYPQEVTDFIEQNKDSLNAERSVSDSIKAGGIMPLAYPERLFQMIKLFLPNTRLNDKKFYETFIRRYPVFKTSNYA